MGVCGLAAKGSTRILKGLSGRGVTLARFGEEDLSRDREGEGLSRVESDLSRAEEGLSCVEAATDWLRVIMRALTREVDLLVAGMSDARTAAKSVGVVMGEFGLGARPAAVPVVTKQVLISPSALGGLTTLARMPAMADRRWK